MWTSWKGCARSEPCRPTASTPKSGASTSSPTQVTAPPGINRAGLCHPHTPLTTPLCSPPRRLPRQLRRLHGLGGASRQDHGAGPARWGAPDARLHDGQKEDLGHLCLLRVHALQGGDGELLPLESGHSRRDFKIFLLLQGDGSRSPAAARWLNPPPLLLPPGQPQDGLHRLRPPGGERPPLPPQADHSR